MLSVHIAALHNFVVQYSIARAFQFMHGNHKTIKVEESDRMKVLSDNLIPVQYCRANYFPIIVIHNNYSLLQIFTGKM